MRLPPGCQGLGTNWPGWGKKSSVLKSSRFKVKSKGRHELFRKVLGGTGILPVRQTGCNPVPPKAAGTEARPTTLFMIYGWAEGSCLTALTD
jgi:hypothetical protein